MPDRTSTLAVGNQAPDFELLDQNNAAFKLSARRNTAAVVIAFHSLAFTGTCQRQMFGYQTALERFRQAGAEIVSISVDSRPSKKAWADQMGGIDYPLLADFEPKGAVAKAYGAYLDARGHHTRAPFIVDKAGTIRSIDSQENPGQDPNNDVLFADLASL